jgi:hypothetical protein
MACPRGEDWLTDEIEGLRSEGVNVLVSGINSELERCAQYAPRLPTVPRPTAVS